MDILAHGLWVGLGAAAWHRHRPLDRRTVGLAVGLAVLPDLVQLAPLVALTLSSSEGWGVLLAHGDELSGHGDRFCNDLPSQVKKPPKTGWPSSRE